MLLGDDDLLKRARRRRRSLLRHVAELGHDRARKLARRDALGEHPVHLRVRAAHGLRDAEERVGEAQRAEDDPEPGRLAAPVERRRVELEGGDDAVEDAEGVVAHARDVDGFGFRAGGGELRDEGVGDGADGAAVDEGVEEEEAAFEPARHFVGETDDGDDAADGEDEAEKAEAPELDGAASETAEEAPADSSSDEPKGVLEAD